MAITMTVCAAVGAAIASAIGASIVIGAIVGACIGAILALTVLYKIDPTVKPIMRLFGVKDEDIVNGYVSTSQLYDSDYANTIQDKLILKYMQNESSSQEYILSYSKYGDNQFRLYNSASKQYLECLTKDIKNEIAVLESKSSLSNTEQTQLDSLYDELDKYEIDIRVNADGFNPDTLISMLRKDLNISESININIDYSYRSQPDDSLWCKYNIQSKYNFYYESDSIVISTTSTDSTGKTITTEKSYDYTSETYNESTNNFTIVLTATDGTTLTETVPVYNTAEYLIICYKIDNRAYLWIKELSVVKVNRYSTLVDSYVYTYSDGSTITLKVEEAKSYANMFPVVCFKHSGHYVNEYDSVTNDRFITKTIYTGTKKILKKIGIAIDTLISNFKESDSENKTTHAFFTWGIPFTTRTEDEKDDEDFVEPEILSKTLYVIFDTLNNNINTEVTTYDNMFNENIPTVSLTYRQNPYHESLIWSPMQETTQDEVIGEVGTYKHTAKATTLKREIHYTVKYLGSEVYSDNTSSESGGGITYKFTYQIQGTIYIKDDEGTVYSSSVIKSKKLATYSEGYGSISHKAIYTVPGTTVDTDDTESVYLSNDSTNSTFTVTANSVGISGNVLGVAQTDSEGNYIYGLLCEAYPEYVLYTKEETVNGESKTAVYKKNATEVTFITYAYKQGKHTYFVSDKIIYDSDGDSYATYALDGLKYGAAYTWTIAKTDTEYTTVSIKSVNIAMVTMKKQISSASTHTIAILCPCYFNIIRNGSDEVTVTSDSIIDYNSNVVLPLPVDILKTLSIKERTELFVLSARITTYVLQKTHLKWYQTARYAKIAKAICFVAIIVITIVTWGAGLKPGMAFLTVLENLALKVAVYVGIALIVKGIVLLSGNNPIVAAIASIVGAIIGAMAGNYIDTGSFSLGMNLQTGCQLAMTCVDSVSNSMQLDLQNQYSKMQRQQDIFNSNYESGMKEIEDSLDSFNKGLQATDLLDITGMGFYGTSIEPSITTYSPSVETRVSLALEGSYNFSSCFTYPEDCVYQAIDFRKQITFNE